MKLPRSKLMWVVACFLAGLFIMAAYGYHTQLWAQTGRLWDLFRNRHQLKRVIKSFGPYSPLALILFHVIHAVVPPLPGEAIEFLGGYLFGIWGGMIYSMIGLIMGSWLSFSIARVFKKRAIERFVSAALRKKFAYLSGQEGTILSFLLFLIPGFPKVALCYILGLTPMGLGTFLVISTVGRIPGAMLATLQGAKAFNQQYEAFLILLGVSALVILLFYFYHQDIHQWIRKRSEAR